MDNLKWVVVPEKWLTEIQASSASQFDSHVAVPRELLERVLCNRHVGYRTLNELRTLRSVEPPREMVERARAWLTETVHDRCGAEVSGDAESLAIVFTALRSQTLDEAARVVDAVEGHFAAKTAIENHGKWTIGSDAARKIADAIRALPLPPGIK